MIVHEQDIDSRLDVSVLICVVEQNDIRVFCLFFVSESCYAFASVSIDGDMYVFTVFQIHLIRFVAYLACVDVLFGEDISFRPSFISSA